MMKSSLSLQLVANPIKALILMLAFILASCSQTTVLPQVFIKAEPSVDAVLDRHPRTLRIFLTGLPDTSKSSVKLYGENGEVSLSHFHTMGADDLMIEIDDHPLPNGKYRVEWSAVLEGGVEEYDGRYEFTVAVEN